MKEDIQNSSNNLIPFAGTNVEDNTQFHPNSKEEKIYRALQNFLANIAKSTRRKYSEAIRDFFQYTSIGNPDKVKFEDVIAYRESLRERDLSASTIALRISALRSLYNHLHVENLVKGNVFAKLRLPRVPGESKTVCLTKEQARNLLSAPDRSTLIGTRDHVILSLLFYNVLRRGAIVNIKKGDIRQEGKFHVLWYRNKGDEQIKTKIKPVLAGGIHEYITSLSDSGYHLKDEDYLFFRLNGNHKDKRNRLTDQAVYCVVRKYSAIIGLEIHPHVLRHSGITCAIDNGAGVEKAQVLAGHKSVQMTLRYYRNKDKLEDHGTDYIEIE